MAEALVEVRGLPELLKLVGDLQGMENIIGKAAEEVADLHYEKMRHYPPPPPGSTYIRTFKLQNSWRKQVILHGDMLTKVQSTSPHYNKYVQSRPDQAQVHQGRWQTAESVQEDTDEEVTEILDAAVQEHINNV